jgi:hypothetical protein
MFKFFKRLFVRKRTPLPRIPVVLKATTPIDARERAEIAAWVHDPMTARVLSLVEARKPSLFVGGSGVEVRSEFDQQAVNNRFHQLQGWELFLSALSVVHIEPNTVRDLQEEYQSDEEI